MQSQFCQTATSRLLPTGIQMSKPKRVVFLLKGAPSSVLPTLINSTITPLAMQMHTCWSFWSPSPPHPLIKSCQADLQMALKPILPTFPPVHLSLQSHHLSPGCFHTLLPSLPTSSLSFHKLSRRIILRLSFDPHASLPTGFSGFARGAKGSSNSLIRPQRLYLLWFPPPLHPCCPSLWDTWLTLGSPGIPYVPGTCQVLEDAWVPLLLLFPLLGIPFSSSAQSCSSKDPALTHSPLLSWLRIPLCS